GQGSRARRRAGCDAHGSPHRNGVSGHGTGQRKAGAGRRCRHYRDELPRLYAVAAEPRRRAFMIIAIDGPAASGQGTLGKRLAGHYGLRHLDTGLIYRAVAKALLDAGHSPEDRARAHAAAEALDPSRFDEAALKAQAVGAAASLVSAIPEVRSVVLA